MGKDRDKDIRPQNTENALTAFDMFEHFFDELGLKIELFVTDDALLCFDVNTKNVHEQWRCIDIELNSGSVKIFDSERGLVLNIHNIEFLEKLKTIFASQTTWVKVAETKHKGP